MSGAAVGNSRTRLAPRRRSRLSDYLREAMTPSRIAEWLLLGLAVALVTFIVVLAGGAPSPLMHLFYLPILFAAIHCGVHGGLIVGVVSGIAAGPWMPTISPDTAHQKVGDWVIRLVMFTFIGMTAGWLSRQEPRPITELWEDALMSRALRIALRRGHITAHLQPLIRLSDGAVVGAEALARWGEPGGRQVPPMRFIPVAERTGQIRALGRSIMEQSLDHADRWPRIDGAQALLTVNVSAVQLAESCFVDSLRDSVAHGKRANVTLCVELTESAVLHDHTDAIDRLTSARDAGVSVAIDDFGTGQSALAYLSDLPVDIVKIDRTFVDMIDSDEKAREMVRLIIEISLSLGATPLAEGVERAEQVSVLRDLGCVLAQGYFFGRPGPADELDWSQRPMPAVRRIGTGSGASRRRRTAA